MIAVTNYAPWPGGVLSVMAILRQQNAYLGSVVVKHEGYPLLEIAVKEFISTSVVAINGEYKL